MIQISVTNSGNKQIVKTKDLIHLIDRLEDNEMQSVAKIGTLPCSKDTVNENSKRMDKIISLLGIDDLNGLKCEFVLDIVHKFADIFFWRVTKSATRM